MATKITVTTLRKGAEMLGLDVGDLKKKKELETLIDEHLQKQELGYECPECGKDIPDVDVCPYCGESFVEEEEVEEVEEAAEETEEKEVKIQEDELPEEIAEEVAEAVSKKVEEKPTKNKEKGKEKETGEKSVNRGRPTGKSKNTEEKEKEFIQLIDKIDKVIGDGFEKRERKTGITYVKERKRIFKAVSTGKALSIEFNVDIKSEDENLKKYTEEEAKARHLGSTRAIYTLGDVDFAIKLVKEALNLK